MTDALLFLHLLSAAAIFVVIVAFSGFLLGARFGPAGVRWFTVLWQVGLIGVLVFGLGLAVDIDTYDPWDPWVLIAIALWLAAGGTAERLGPAYRDAASNDSPVPSTVVRAQVFNVVLIVLLLADMIWKPWA